jgi:pimeloyl-ACP methyl ester carboxylesterase
VHDDTALSADRPLVPRSNFLRGGVNFQEAGAGPLVVLVHSSMAGARQWSALTRDLEGHFLVRAVNLFGYDGTPAWSEPRSPSLDDFADLVAQAVPDATSEVHLVGHSLGGAIAMQAAARQLRGRVRSLVLFEPSLFYLLDHYGCQESFQEISMLATYTRRCIWGATPEAAAERFIDYWCGPGTWAASSADRRSWFAGSIELLPHEWTAVLTGKTTLQEWNAALPRHTLVMSSTKTSRPARELVGILLRSQPKWAFASICDSGHMAPLTHPQVVNPIIGRFLHERATAM